MSVDEKEKLKILLNHWIEHNTEHSEEFEEWANTAKKIGEDEVQKYMLNAASQMEKSASSLRRALNVLKGGKK